MTGDIMKKVNSIRIFFVLAVAAIIGMVRVFPFQKTREPQELQTTEQRISEQITEESEETTPVSQTMDYKYIIVEEGDYLTVYYADRTTVYEYTDIRYSDLEDSLRQKIRKGFCVKDEETLFGFLENYSS